MGFMARTTREGECGERCACDVRKSFFFCVLDNDHIREKRNALAMIQTPEASLHPEDKGKAEKLKGRARDLFVKGATKRRKRLSCLGKGRE